MYTVYNSSDAAILSMIRSMWLAILAIIIVTIAGKWKMLEKAGKPGWASIVPFYSDFVEYEIFWGQGWLFLVPIVLSLLNVIPILGILAIVVSILISFMHCYKNAEAFGQGMGFALGLFFLKPIFTCILGFSSKYKYLGVPMDGTSFSQLKEMKDNKLQKGNVKYEQPAKPEQKSVQFEKPAEESKPIEPEVITPEKPVDSVQPAKAVEVDLTKKK